MSTSSPALDTLSSTRNGRGMGRGGASTIPTGLLWELGSDYPPSDETLPTTGQKWHTFHEKLPSPPETLTTFRSELTNPHEKLTTFGQKLTTFSAKLTSFP